MIHHHNYKNKDLLQTIETFSCYQKVNFALYCSKEVEHLFSDQRVVDCNLAVEQWLKGDKFVDLIITRNNAWNAWRIATCSAAYSVASSAWHTSYAADNFSHSASSSAIWHAARAKSCNLYPNDETKRDIAYNQFFNEYKQIAQNWLSNWIIPNFPKDEPDFPIFDFLQDFNLISCLLPKKRKYYHLNLNGFNIKHVNEMELLKLIDTIHIKTILRRIINNDSSSS